MSYANARGPSLHERHPDFGAAAEAEMDAPHHYHHNNTNHNNDNTNKKREALVQFVYDKQIAYMGVPATLVEAKQAARRCFNLHRAQVEDLQLSLQITARKYAILYDEAAYYTVAFASNGICVVKVEVAPRAAGLASSSSSNPARTAPLASSSRHSATSSRPVHDTSGIRNARHAPYVVPPPISASHQNRITAVASTSAQRHHATSTSDARTHEPAAATATTSGISHAKQYNAANHNLRSPSPEDRKPDVEELLRTSSSGNNTASSSSSSAASSSSRITSTLSNQAHPGLTGGYRLSDYDRVTQDHSTAHTAGSPIFAAVGSNTAAAEAVASTENFRAAGNVVVKTEHVSRLWVCSSDGSVEEHSNLPENFNFGKLRRKLAKERCIAPDRLELKFNDDILQDLNIPSDFDMCEGQIIDYRVIPPRVKMEETVL